MRHNNFISSFFAVVDIVVGAVLLLFFALGPVFIRQIPPVTPLSTEFFIRLAAPAFITIVGIANLIRSASRFVLTFFASFLVIVNSLTEMLSPLRPSVLAEGAAPLVVHIFHYFLPAAAIVYFGAHSLSSFILMKKDKSIEETTARSDVFAAAETYCAHCHALISAEDEACPACGALMRGVLCPSCGYEGKRMEFRDGNCPRCGIKILSESDD